MPLVDLFARFLGELDGKLAITQFVARGVYQEARLCKQKIGGGLLARKLNGPVVLL